MKKPSLGMLFAFGVLLSGVATAQTLEEMIDRTNKSQAPSTATNTPTTAAPTTPAVPVPAPTPTPAVAPTTPTAPVAAAQPSPSAPMVSRELPLESGKKCGMFGAILGGCPKNGLVVPPNMPELTAMVAELTPLLNVSQATREDRLNIVRLGNRLSKIDPAALQAQIKAMKSADPAYQFGLLKRITPSEQALLRGEGTKAMLNLVNDATGSGAQIENGIRQALQMLRSVRSHSEDVVFSAAMDKKIAQVQKLAELRLGAATAKQTLQPFYDENNMARNLPSTKKTITNEQIANTLTLLSVEGDSDEPYTEPSPASGSRDGASALDHI